MKNRKYSMGMTAALVLLIGMIGSSLAMAAQAYRLLQVGTDGDQVVTYIEGDTAIEGIECQIGMIPCEEVRIEKMAESPFSFHTIILVDNSLSVTQENKDKIFDLLGTYMQEKNENEYISLAVYGEDIEFLLEKSQDAQALQEAIDSIQQNNQDTYLTDIMYDLLDTLEEGEYTRFIVVSDGVDNKSIGITKEELTAKLKEHSYPIYALGHIYKNNEEQIENMFALSRATNGKEFLLDEIEDVASVVAELKNVQELMCIRTTIPNELRDGSSMSMLLTITNASGGHEIRTQIALPFSLREEEAEPVAEPEPAPESEPEPEPVAEPVEAPAAETTANSSIISILGVVVLIIAVIALIIVIWHGRKKDNQDTKDKKKAEKKIEIPGKEPNPQQLSSTPPAAEFIPDPDMTMVLERRYLLVLKDVQSPGRIFKYPLDNKVVIGRSVDKVNIAIDYNMTVSGQHCEITSRNNRFFIRDLNSSNKTCLNGHVLKEEAEIFSGSIIKVGEVEFSVEMIPI